MSEKRFFSFEGKSQRIIESGIQRARDLAEVDMLNRKEKSGMGRMAGRIKDLLQSRRQRGEKTRLIREAMERDGSELISSIEKYASMTLSAELKLRLQREEHERLQLEQERGQLHNEIRSLGAKIGISEEKILELMEMRVHDRLAESEIKNISIEATDAAGIPLHAHDDDLVYAPSDPDLYQWRLPDPEERKNTYSLVYDCVFRPHDNSYYELEQCKESVIHPDNIVPRGRIDHVINLLKKTAEDLKSKGVFYSFTQFHYCHDDENYPRDDWMAFRHLSFFIRCPKKEIRKVIQRLEFNAKGE